MRGIPRLLAILFVVFTDAMTSPTPPSTPSRRNRFTQSQGSDAQSYTPSSEHISPSLDHTQFNYGYMNPSHPQIIEGYEHLIPHFNIELNPNEIHSTVHPNLIPEHYTDERNYRTALYEDHEAEEQAISSHQSQQDEAASLSRRLSKNKGKQAMSSRQSVNSRDYLDNQRYVNNQWDDDVTHDHGHTSNISSESEMEPDIEDEDENNGSEDDHENEQEHHSDNEYVEEEQEEVRGRRGRPRQPGSRIDTRELARSIFIQIWNTRGLSTEMEPETLAEHVAYWKVDQEGGFEACSIGTRAVHYISESKPESEFPQYTARYTAYMREIEKAVRRVSRKMNKEQKYVNLKETNKIKYKTIALNKALKDLHESVAQTGSYISYKHRASSDSEQHFRTMRKVTSALKEHLEAQNIDIDKADLDTLVMGSFALKVNHLNHSEIISFIREYLMEERGLEEKDITIFNRKARLAAKNLIYNQARREVKEERLRRKREANRNHALS